MVPTIRGQYHTFMLIPIMEHHTRWFDAGPVSIGVEARALGDSAENMMRGPSIHVCSADRSEEYIRFDVFGTGAALSLHPQRPAREHAVGLRSGRQRPDDPLGGAMRSTTGCRRCCAMPGRTSWPSEVEQMGWDTLGARRSRPGLHRSAQAPREHDLLRAKEGMDWMYAWKAVHPQFNTLDEQEY